MRCRKPRRSGLEDGVDPRQGGGAGEEDQDAEEGQDEQNRNEPPLLVVAEEQGEFGQQSELGLIGLLVEVVGRLWLVSHRCSVGDFSRRSEGAAHIAAAATAIVISRLFVRIRRLNRGAILLALTHARATFLSSDRSDSQRSQRTHQEGWENED